MLAHHRSTVLSFYPSFLLKHSEIIVRFDLEYASDNDNQRKVSIYLNLYVWQKHVHKKRNNYHPLVFSHCLIHCKSARKAVLEMQQLIHYVLFAVYYAITNNKRQGNSNASFFCILQSLTSKHFIAALCFVIFCTYIHINKEKPLVPYFLIDIMQSFWTEWWY